MNPILGRVWAPRVQIRAELGRVGRIGRVHLAALPQGRCGGFEIEPLSGGCHEKTLISGRCWLESQHLENEE